MKETIISAGIDIGTTTTQILFSRFTIDDLSNGYTVPRIIITGKQILYQGDIYFTPLLDPETIDAAGIKKIIRQEYEKAGISRDEVKTGAVIITGDTARKKNAAAVLEALSGYAGDFVVATAGPDLESVLSGYGAGTNVIAERTHSVVANIDIGGGTSNISVFKNGTLLETACLDIGGRLIKIDAATNHIIYIYDKIRTLAANRMINIAEGGKVDESVLSGICRLMGSVLTDALHLTSGCSDLPFYTNSGKRLKLPEPVSGLTFSGGVAECMYHDIDTDSVYRYGDIGVLLGRELHKNEALKRVTWHIPSQTIRATVAGAGMYTTKLTGSTILYDSSRLPVKNVPVLHLDSDIQNMATEIAEKLPLYLHGTASVTVAIAFRGSRSTSFADIETLAGQIVTGTEAYIRSGHPLIVVTEEDISKALGFVLRLSLPSEYPVICIDGISTRLGDYIDIGTPVAGGQVLPVVIKTLVFNT